MSDNVQAETSGGSSGCSLHSTPQSTPNQLRKASKPRIERVASLQELEKQYSIGLGREATLQSCTHDGVSDVSSDVHRNLEKAWTMVLSHLSRRGTEYLRSERKSGQDSEQDVELMQESIAHTPNLNSKSDKTNQSENFSILRKRRTSFFQTTGVSLTSQRTMLQDQSIATRIMNISSIRWLYNFGSRLASLCDQFTDILLLVSLLSSGNTSHAMRYLCFILLPYTILALILLAPLTRRSDMMHRFLFADDVSDVEQPVRRLKLVPVLLSPLWLPVYVSCVVPTLVVLDFYVYFVLAGKDLATTRYLLYYWRLKSIVEILFEALPQTVFVLTTDLSHVGPLLVLFSLSSSILLLAWSLIKIWRGGHETGLGAYMYFKRYYIEQGIEMIPFLEAIVQNNLIELSLRESLQLSEWKHIAKSLFFNFSIQKLTIVGQHHLSAKVWSLLFYSLENNRLHAIDLTRCYLMGTKPVCGLTEMLRIDNNELANMVTSSLNRPNQSFNPFSKVSLNDSQESSCVVPVTQKAANTANRMSNAKLAPLLVLYSLQRVMTTSRHTLKCVRLQENNIGPAVPLLLEALSQCTQLQTLDLSHNVLGATPQDTLADSFATLLEECTQLSTLILDHNGLSDSIATVFVSILSRITLDKEKRAEEAEQDANVCALEHVDVLLGMSDVDEEHSLTFLSLEGNGLTLFGAKTLLRACNALNITINLEDNSIKTHEWMKLMGTMLERCNTNVNL